jgi:plastocyanin
MKTSAIAATGLLLLVTACSGSSGTKSSGPVAAPSPSGGSSSSSSAGAGAILQIKSFKFNGPQVAPGTTITVKNFDEAAHTVTSDTSGVFDSGNVDQGSPVTFKAPAKAGTYTFHCNYHSFMHGTLTVS